MKDLFDEFCFFPHMNYHIISSNFLAKRFAIKIYQNDLKFMKENYLKIISKDIIKNLFFIACAFTKDQMIIEFFINKFNVNLNSDDGDNNDNDTKMCLLIACEYNTNFDVIKFLIENCKTNLKRMDGNFDNCLTISCYKNPNLDIIKYLIEECKMDVNHTDVQGNNCLLIACWKNTNINIIKYLIEEHHMNINFENIYLENCLDKATNNKNFRQICVYIIENTNFMLIINTWKRFYIFESAHNIFTNNYDKLNNILKSCTDEYCKKKLYTSLKSINPLLLNIINRKKANIEDPFDNKFHIFCKYVEKLKSEISIHNICETISLECNQIKYQKLDYRNKPNILFKHNNILYYGNRQIIYNTMLFLEDIKDSLNFDDVIVLDSEIPQYIVNLYIYASYSKKFDINKIIPSDIIQFLKFIEQYPTTILSLNLLEIHIIDYFDQYKILYNDEIISLCRRNCLKLMYLHIHNRSLALKI